MRPLIPLLLCLLLIGCSPPIISKKEFNARCNKTVNLHNTLTGHVYYQGSKDGYDYFQFEPIGTLPSHARLKEGDIVLQKRIPCTEEREKWQLVAPPDLSNLLIKTNSSPQPPAPNK